MSASANKEFHLLDYVDFLVKRKAMFVLAFVLSFVFTYLAVFFFIEEQYEATALLVPRGDEATSVASGLLRSMKGLPIGVGTKAPRSEMDLYATVIYSRTMLEDIVRTFGLVEVYGLDTSSVDCMEKAVKRLKNEIFTKETEEWSYIISVRAGTPVRASEMVNTILQKMNERIVALNVGRSRENRKFLERRVAEVRLQLRASEDTLRAFQERTGMLDAKGQLEGIVSAHTSLEAELAAKRIQEGILEQMYDQESPQVRELNMQISAYEKKLAEFRTKSMPGGTLLALNQLPRTAVEFLRRYREVQINNLILEYITPLFEQAKLDETKDYPVLQVIDYGVPPAKKSYPPRTLFALIGAFSVTLLVSIVLILRDALTQSEDQRLKTVLADIRRWTWASWKTRV
jgi:tyrosine-protein kinase Etk/Wzc